MSLESVLPKNRMEVEREIGLMDKDSSKPVLLKLIEALKYGGGGNYQSNEPVTVKKEFMQNENAMPS